MNHVSILKLERNFGLEVAKKTLLSRATGDFYTPESVGRLMAQKLVERLKKGAPEIISVIDPFAGDGRLVSWLIEYAFEEKLNPIWQVTLWEQSALALEQAKQRLISLQKKIPIKIVLNVARTDSFMEALKGKFGFDVVITNPPWEALKPDSRELAQLSKTDQNVFTNNLRKLDQLLAAEYPFSQPTRKFAGWGTNLSRVGLELSAKLLRKHGQIAIVLPSSTFSDQVSVKLREWLACNISISTVVHFAAETRLFEKVDQASIILFGSKITSGTQKFILESFDENSSSFRQQIFNLSHKVWRNEEFNIPFAIHGNAQAFLDSISKLPTWRDAEVSDIGLWAGRELDETGLAQKLGKTGSHRFVKGKMVGRFQLLSPATDRVCSITVPIPKTADLQRVAWRDVSRPTQRRRMQATLVEPGYVTGNSLNVALFASQEKNAALALLAVANSLVFEVQVRARSATSHVSLGVVRGVRIPDMRNKAVVKTLAAVANLCIENPQKYEAILEVVVAKAYGIGKATLETLLPSFPGLSPEDRGRILSSSEW